MPTDKKGASVSKVVAKRVPTPKPKPIVIVCNLCGEDWDAHPVEATAADCIEILKTKNATLSLKVANPGCCHHHWTYTYPYQWYSNTSTITVTQPVQVTLTAPYWYSPNIAGTSDTVNISNNTYDEATSKSIAALVSSITA